MSWSNIKVFLFFFATCFFKCSSFVVAPADTTTRNSLKQSKFVLRSKWDNLVDDEEPTISPLISRDMRYLEGNLLRQNKNFAAIKDAGGVEMVNDVYARDPDDQVFWFIGKVARISDVSIEQCIARQYALIEEHAARLRPLELFKKVGSIELWLAPGDSELDVAYNRPSCQFVGPMSRQVEGSDVVKNTFVGFQGEVYLDGEEGFRCFRKDDGSPLKPEMKTPEEEGGNLSDEEMKKIAEVLKGQDLSSLIVDKDS